MTRRDLTLLGLGCFAVTFACAFLATFVAAAVTR